MSNQSTESKRLLSYVIAEWACALRYEHLSPEAIQAAKLFWFDTIGCALGGSQQDDAKILLKHHQAMVGGNGKASSFVSGFSLPRARLRRGTGLFSLPACALRARARHPAFRQRPRRQCRRDRSSMLVS